MKPKRLEMGDALWHVDDDGDVVLAAPGDDNQTMWLTSSDVAAMWGAIIGHRMRNVVVPFPPEAMHGGATHTSDPRELAAQGGTSRANATLHVLPRIEHANMLTRFLRHFTPTR